MNRAGIADAREHGPVRVLFLTRRLDFGGAERQLLALLKGLDKQRFAVTLATFYSDGGLASEAREIPEIDWRSLDKRGAWDLGFVWRLQKLVARLRPHVVHAYLTESNVLALLAAKPLGSRVVWGLRASNIDFKRYDWTRGLLFRVGAWLSPLVDRIVANSEAGRLHHAAQGYASGALVVIPNGIDTARFRPDAAAGRQARVSWGAPEDAPLIGLLARLDPMKGHETFMRAAARLARDRTDAWFVCVGAGPEAERARLCRLGKELGIGQRLLWVDAQEDVLAAHNALEIATSASTFGEGFSNAVGEAMACGVPCVVTDVGDSAAIVGDTGRVVSPGDPEALAASWKELLALPAEMRRELGRRARARIEQEFCVERLVQRMDELLADLARPQ